MFFFHGLPKTKTLKYTCPTCKDDKREEAQTPRVPSQASTSRSLLPLEPPQFKLYFCPPCLLSLGSHSLVFTRYSCFSCSTDAGASSWYSSRSVERINDSSRSTSGCSAGRRSDYPVERSASPRPRTGGGYGAAATVSVRVDGTDSGPRPSYPQC